MRRDSAAVMRFYATFIDRFGEVDTAVIHAPCFELAQKAASGLPGMARCRGLTVDPMWDVVMLPDGSAVFRWDWAQRVCPPPALAPMPLAAE